MTHALIGKTRCAYTHSAINQGGIDALGLFSELGGHSVQDGVLAFSCNLQHENGATL